jgi:hypothetical protein
MSADAPLNEIVAFLLRVLDNVENASDEPPISTLQKPADLSEARPKSLSAMEELGSNRFVERIAAAMSRLHSEAPTRVVG